MANAMRILYISGEVAPFTNSSETAKLARTLPEQMHEHMGYETRIMMPRYGIISERRNRLHEVIRLSGTEIAVGSASETLKVKVASIPGIRLQVYFMDNTRLFKRKGIFASKDGKQFPDNPERALFFGRAVLETIRKLGWKPDLVHAFGWMSGFVPYLLRHEYTEDPLFEESKVVYTPDQVPFQAPLTATLLATLGLPETAPLLDMELNGLGTECADLALFPPSLAPSAGQPQLPEAVEAMAEVAATQYDQLLGVPA